MHVPFKSVFIGLHLLCLTSLVSSKRRGRFQEKQSENEILEKTHIITVKFPNIQIPVNTVKREHTIKPKRIDTSVEPVQENCQAKTFKTELNQLRQKVKCEPRNTVVDLIPPAGATLTPNAVLVKRCGGMCNGFKRCLPVQQTNIKFFVKQIKNNQLHCSSIIVTEDTKCRCGCLQSSEDCNENQMYNKEKCACICRNEKDYAQCIENINENMHWDEESCSCICQQNRSCTTGTYWVESDCRCAKMLP